MRIKHLIATALCAAQFVASAAITGTGSPEEPWQIGSPNSEDMIAYTNGTGKLVIDGMGNMIEGVTLPWASLENEILSIEICAPVRSIGQLAFPSIWSLGEVVIPETVTNIGYCAFNNCTDLTNVTIRATTPPAGANEMFSLYSTLVIHVPEASALAYAQAKYWSRYFENFQPWAAGENLTAVLNEDGTLVITGTGDIKALGSYGNYPWSRRQSEITAINFPAELTGIGSRAFYGFSSLTAGEIPAAVTNIGGGAFINTPNVTVNAGNTAYEIVNGVIFDKRTQTVVSGVGSPAEVTIPSTATRIGVEAFAYCEQLSDVTFEAGSQLETIGGGAFLGDELLGEIEIPASVKTIVAQAFSYCSQLSNVTVRATTPPAMGEDVFSECSSLATIQVPEGSAETYKAAEGWSAFADIIVESSSEAPIGSEGNPWFVGSPNDEDVFAYTNGTGKLIIGGTGDTWSNFLERAPGWENVADQITSVEIGKGVTSLGIAAFSSSYTQLSSVTFEADSQLETIGEVAFQSVEQLAEITIPASVKTIGANAFSLCTQLSSVTFEDGSQLETIGESAFFGDQLIGEIEIPANVTDIGAMAFCPCNALSSVTVRATTPPAMGEDVFGGCSALATIQVPEGSAETYKAAEGWSAFADIIVESSSEAPLGSEGNPWQIGSPNAADVVAYTNGMGKLIIEGTGATTQDFDANPPGWFFFEDAITSVEIGEGVTSLGDLAFQCESCMKSLASVKLPSTLKSIGRQAFCGCEALTSITLPEGLESIGMDAFGGCISLAAVTIPGSVKNIDANAFAECLSLGEVEIPASVTNIGDYAFGNCSSLTNVTVQSSVPPTLGIDAFDGCNLKLFIHVPEASAHAYASAAGWSNYVHLLQPWAVDSGLTAVLEADGTLVFTGEGKILPVEMYRGSGYLWEDHVDDITAVVIPGGVTIIGDGAFAGCGSLTSVTLRNVTPPSLGASVFDGCADGFKIYVPFGSGESYKLKWPGYADNFVEMEREDKILTIPTVEHAKAYMTVYLDGYKVGEEVQVITPEITFEPAEGVTEMKVVLRWVADSGYRITAGETEEIVLTGDMTAKAPTVEEGAAPSGGSIFPNGDGGVFVKPTRATVYEGVTLDANGAVSGTVTVKLGKPNNKGEMTVSATVKTLADNKSYIFKPETKKVSADVNGPLALTLVGASAKAKEHTFTLVIEGDALSGTFNDESIDGARNVFKVSKDPKCDRLAPFVGCHTLAFVAGDAVEAACYVKVAKSGSVQVRGKFADGASISKSVKAEVGDGLIAAPVTVRKTVKGKIVTFAFRVAFDEATQMVTAINVSPVRVTDKKTGEVADSGLLDVFGGQPTLTKAAVQAMDFAVDGVTPDRKSVTFNETTGQLTATLKFKTVNEKGRKVTVTEKLYGVDVNGEIYAIYGL